MITRYTCLFLGMLLLAGCDRGTPAPATAPAGGGNAGDADAPLAHLDFQIVGAYAHQQPVADYPGHADGGNWTFLDCMAGNVPFVVGLENEPTAGGASVPAAHGRAMFRTADRDTGNAFLTAFASGFQMPVPPALPPKPLTLELFPTTTIGTSLQHAAAGSGVVLGGGGSWTSMRWAVSTPRFQADVFFNFDMTSRRGEFVEKDFASREELVLLWARLLRDGPRGLRTPADDHNMALTGPHLGTPTLVGEPVAHDPMFVPGGKWLLYVAPKVDNSAQQVWRVECAHPENRRSLITLPVIYQIQSVDPEGQHVLVEEKIPDTPGMVTDADPSRFLWLDLSTSAVKPINGPWKPRDVDLNPGALSPDSHFMVLSESRTRDDRKGGYTELYVVDLEANTASAVDINQQWVEILGWLGQGDNLRVAVRTGFNLDPPEKRQACLVDPSTGNWVAATPAQIPAATAHQLPSPDGQNVAEIVDRQRLVIHRATGVTRELVFNPDDKHFVDDGCVAWLDNQYMSFFNPYPVVIDTRIMKMNYLLDRDRIPNTVRYSQEFKYAAVLLDDGLFLAPIEMPH